MDIQLTSLRRNLRGLSVRFVIAASLALVAVTITAFLQPTTQDEPVAAAYQSRQVTTAAESFRSSQYPADDYRIYLVRSHEQAEQLGLALSDLETGEVAQPITWRYEVVMLQSSEDERQFERNHADLNDSRIALGHNEIWVVDWRSL